MKRIKISELFPTKWSAIVFVSYMTLFISQGILVTYSQESGKYYQYNIVLVVSITEFVKLITCLLIYSTMNGWYTLFEQAFLHIKLLWLYFVPAFLYCLYNNLSFVNLLHYDPATYFILLQLRVVITGVLFQIFFRKTLTGTQWLSLIILTIGCMMKNIEFDFVGNGAKDVDAITEDGLSKNVIPDKSDGMGLNFGTVSIIVQVLCSCFAGVYIEFLLKTDGLHVDIFIQNVFMYIDSIVANLLLTLLWPGETKLFENQSLAAILDYRVFLVIINNAAVGIITSFFLKYLNSVLKTVASSLELIFITLFSWILFSVSIKANTIISIFIVLFSIVLYSSNPVQNPVNVMEVKKKEISISNA